jgi:broad specificity phosphatase PhoE
MLLAALALPLAAGAQVPPVPSDGLLVVVVRHAEKAQDDSRDPDLNEAGRAQQTAQPSAEAQGLEVEVREFVSRDPDEDARALRETLLREHRGEAVLVVGHSNTVPAIVEALSGQKAEPMPETEYDRLSLIRIEADGRAELRVERY